MQVYLARAMQPEKVATASSGGGSSAARGCGTTEPRPGPGCTASAAVVAWYSFSSRAKLAPAGQAMRVGLNCPCTRHA